LIVALDSCFSCHLPWPLSPPAAQHRCFIKDDAAPLLHLASFSCHLFVEFFCRHRLPPRCCQECWRRLVYCHCCLPRLLSPFAAHFCSGTNADTSPFFSRVVCCGHWHCIMALQCSNADGVSTHCCHRRLIVDFPPHQQLLQCCYRLLCFTVMCCRSLHCCFLPPPH